MGRRRMMELRVDGIFRSTADGRPRGGDAADGDVEVLRSEEEVLGDDAEDVAGECGEDRVRVFPPDVAEDEAREHARPSLVDESERSPRAAFASHLDRPS